MVFIGIRLWKVFIRMNKNMAKSKIIFQSKEEVIGKHIPSKLWIKYSGVLSVYDRKTNPVVLKLKSDIYDSILYNMMEEKKEFKGVSVSQVYGKLAKWFNRNDIIFQN